MTKMRIGCIEPACVLVLILCTLCFASGCGYARLARISHRSNAGFFGSHSAAFKTQRGIYNAGAAAEFITPRKNQWLAGYHPGRKSTGIHDNIEARVLALEDPIGKLYIFVTLDFLGFLHEDVARLRTRINLPNAEILVFSTHNHSGPDTIGVYGNHLGRVPILSGRDENYIDQTMESIINATHRALHTMRPVMMRVGSSNISGLQTKVVGAGFDRLNVLEFITPDNHHRVATIVNFGCHPTTVTRNDTLLTTDFPGALRRYLDQELHTTTLFIQGAVGGVTYDHRIFRNPDHYHKSIDVGLAFGKIARAALVHATTVHARDPIIFRRSTVRFPVKHKLFWLASALGYMPNTLMFGERITEMSILRLGSLTVIMVPGEIFPDLAEQIYAMGGRGTQVWSLANDEIGYILDRPKFYSRALSYWRSVSLGPDTGPIVLWHAKNLLDATR